MIKGRTINAALGASIYIACREASITRTLNDIAVISNTSYKEISPHIQADSIEFGFKNTYD